MTIKPITPAEAMKQKRTEIPDEIVQIVNDMLVQKLSIANPTSGITLFQKDILDRAAEALDMTTSEIFARNWMDIEPIFRDAGWDVEYDKPAYNESYDAFFAFYPRTK